MGQSDTGNRKADSSSSLSESQQKKLSLNNNHEIGVLEEGTAMEAERGHLGEKTG